MDEMRLLLRRNKIWNHHLEKVCNEIGENELIYKPMPDSNSAAWILVHLINHYHEFLELTKSEKSGKLPPESERPSEKSIADMQFSHIFSILQDYRTAFISEIEKMGDKGNLDSGVPAGEDKSWRDLIHRVVNHEIYHLGQLAYIARILQQKANSK